MSDDKNVVLDEQNTPEVDTPETSNEEEVSEDTKAEATLTQEQINKIIQERLAKEREKSLKEIEKTKKETQEQIRLAQEEAEKMALLTAEEKEKELMAKSKKEIEERERAIAIRENTTTAKEMLQEAEISSSLAKYFVNDNADDTVSNIDEFSQVWKEALAKAVSEQLKNAPPKDYSINSKDTTDKVVKAF